MKTDTHQLMNSSKPKLLRMKSHLFHSVIVILVFTTFGCSKYTVTTTENNPADIAFKQKVITSLWWGKVNHPQRLVDSCGNAGLDEVKISSNIGYSLLHIVTLGIVHKVKVEWKCHKPCSDIGFKPTP